MSLKVDNLVQLLEPDSYDVADLLHRRCLERKLYTGLGDDLISVTPHEGGLTPEHSSAVGQEYVRRKPPGTPLCPEHVYSLVHDVYSDVTVSSTAAPHSLLVTGMSGSGKTQLCQTAVTQFFREARVPATDPLPAFILKAMRLLHRLTSVRGPAHSQSSLQSQVITLYFGQDGYLETAQFSSYLFNSRHVIPHVMSRDFPNFVYDVTAGLLDRGSCLRYAIFQESDFDTLLSALPRMSSLEFSKHRAAWLDLVDSFQDLGFSQYQGSHDNGESIGPIDVLIALAMLALMTFDRGQSQRQGQGHGDLSATDTLFIELATEALGLPPGSLAQTLMTPAENCPTMVRQTQLEPHEMHGARCARDQVVCELYARLVNTLTAELNETLPPVEATYTAVHVVDLATFNEHPVGTLETLCQNLTAERILQFLNEATFDRPNALLKKEGVKSPTKQHFVCEDLCEVGFSVPKGLLRQLESTSQHQDISCHDIVASLDRLFGPNKNVYTGSKKLGEATFALNHSHLQVSYPVTSQFRYDNLITPHRRVQVLLTSSLSTFVKEMYSSIQQTPDEIARMHYFSTFCQLEVERLIARISGCTPHIVRCIRFDCKKTTRDLDDVIYQVRAASIPEVTHQKKFYFSHWFPLKDFLHRYSFLTPQRKLRSKDDPGSCRTVLRHLGLLSKGTVVSTNYVFLQHWTKRKLDHLARVYLWKVKVVQACVRGHQVREWLRQHFGERFTSLSKQKSVRFEKPRKDEEQESLFTVIAEETVDRMPDMTSFGWAKVIVLEEGTQLAKVYASELSLLITGSTKVFDEIEFGLGRYCDGAATSRTKWLIGNFGKGLELKRDSDGSLLLRRLTQHPIVVKNVAGGYLSADLIHTRGALPFNTFVKIIDMNEFQSLIQLTIKRGKFTKGSLMPRCVTAIDVGWESKSATESPLCIAIVNLAALTLLSEHKEITSASMLTSHMNLGQKSEEEVLMREVQAEAKQRRQRQKWSRCDHRPQLRMKEPTSRKLREELRKRGEKISDHMRYSWEEDKVSRPCMNMDQLYEKIRNGDSDLTNVSESQGNVHQWAKVDVALRKVLRDLNSTD